MGRPIQGLLDSGASRTLIGSAGVQILQDLPLPQGVPCTATVTVADGRKCPIQEVIDVPFELDGVVKILPTLIVPSLACPLILGLDFWKKMKVVPDLSQGTWEFSHPVGTVEAPNGLIGIELLTANQLERLDQITKTYFASLGPTLVTTTRVEHVIEVGEAKPIKQRYYPVSPKIQQAMYAELDDMLRDGVVEPSKSAWSSPVVMIRKTDGSFRFCVDYRKLNAVTKRDAYPLPYVSHILDRLRGTQFLTSLDIKSAYWQVPVHIDSRECTAFTVPGRGLYQFRRLPFGLHNSPATWQRLIDEVLGADLEPWVFVYLDDIVISTPNFEMHIEILEKVLDRLREAGLTLNQEKCKICRTELRYLGYVVDRQGLKVDPEKVAAIVHFPAPKTTKEVRRFVGMASWYRRFVPEFSTIVSPITALLKKGKKWEWGCQAQSAFRELKEKLISAPILTGPDFNYRFTLTTDASLVGIGAVLSQELPEGERVIAYASRTLTRSERNYSATELECLAVVWAVEKLRPYLEGADFTVVTDHHSLQWLTNLKDPAGRLARWALRLQQYQFTVIHRPGKQNVVADALSRALDTEIQAMNVSVEDQDAWYKKMVARIEDDPGKYPLWRITGTNLYRRVPTRTSEIPLNPWKQVVPKSRRREVLCENHDAPMAGHLGSYKTRKRISELYYWPGMSSDVTRYVSRCRTCLSTKPDQTKPKGLMGKARVADAPWQIVATDLMGPFPPSSSQNRYLLVVMDTFSKFVTMFPLRTATSKSVLRHIESDVFMMFGVPQTIICDNGPQYKSREFLEGMKKYQVEIMFTPFYTPQCNPTERANRTIKSMIAAYVEGNHRSWDKVLPQLRYAINTAVHETAGHSPSFINFGRTVYSSGHQHLLHQNQERSKVDSFDQRKKELDGLPGLIKEVKQRLLKAHQVQGHSYNLRKRGASFNVGDIVWKRTYPLSNASEHFSAKLAPRYQRCTVKKKLSSVMYELQDEDGASMGRWHVKDLKTPRQRSDASDSSTRSLEA